MNTASADTAPRPKRAELLVAAIEDRVEREQLQPGFSLGTEPQLMALYQVSRETLRNAIRQLERHGVATMRRGGDGGGGGLVVAASASQTAVHAITAHLEFSDIGWAEIVEARTLIDIESAVLASRRVDAAAIARLRQLSIDLDHGPSTVRDMSRRHLALPGAIADIAGNPVVKLFTAALSDWTVDVLPSELGSKDMRDREMHRVNDVLRSLVEAVSIGDALGARQAAEAFAARSFKVSSLLEERRRRTAVDDWLKAGSADGESKLAHRLALALSHDVAMRGWPPERFGAEAELIARFGVSRSVWREAIRLLEMHGIARPQRGRGGGLMIGRPNAAYTIDSAKRYLRRAALQPADYLTVRNALEAGAIHLAVARASDADMQTLLVLSERIANADDSQIVAASIDWHAQLSGLGGNRALALLLRILFALTEQPQARLPEEIKTALRSRHARLTQALIARDETRAQAVAQEHVAWLNRVLELGLAALRDPATEPA